MCECINIILVSVLLFVHCRTNELREKLSSAQEEMRQLDMDIEENQGY